MAKSKRNFQYATRLGSILLMGALSTGCANLTPRYSLNDVANQTGTSRDKNSITITGKLVTGGETAQKVDGYYFSPAAGMYITEGNSEPQGLFKVYNRENKTVDQYVFKLSESTLRLQELKNLGYVLSAEGTYVLSEEATSRTTSELESMASGKQDLGEAIPAKTETKKEESPHKAFTKTETKRVPPYTESTGRSYPLEDYHGLVPETAEISGWDLISLPMGSMARSSPRASELKPRRAVSA